MRTSTPRRVVMPVTAIVAAAVMGASLAACGTSSSTGAAAAATATASSSGSISAYRDCLASHGVTLPSGRPSVTAGGTRPSGGARPSANPSERAAMQACASLRPKGTGTGRNFGGSALTAFRTCMKNAGVTVPTGSPRTASASPGTGGRGILGGLNTSDPTVAKAYNECKALLPTRKPTSSASSSSTAAG